MAEPTIAFRRLAEQVADELRRRILRGDLADGSVLPKEDELLLEFPVSKPSLREAMRILEAEGLLRVRRGKLGGAVVGRPNAANVAYTVGLVLGSQEVGLSDVGNALLQVEPACVGLCAQRADRGRTVVPQLRRVHAEAVEAVEDLLLVTSASRRFHESLVSLYENAERGYHAVSFSENPAMLGLPTIHSGYWEPLMAACADTGTVVNLHIGSSGTSPSTIADAPPDVQGVLSFAYAISAAVDWLYSGLCTRHPDLKICLSEGGIGWVAGLLD